MLQVRGATGLGHAHGRLPPGPWISDGTWNDACFADKAIPGMEGLVDSLTRDAAEWKEWWVGLC